MNKKKLKKGCLAGILAVLLLTAGLQIPYLYAANWIDTSKTCSLTLEAEEAGTFANDLLHMRLQVKLYQVAEVKKTGKYVHTKGFQSLKFEQLVHGKGDWEKAAVQAAELAEGKDADAVFQIVNGTGTKEGLKPGMYLVLVESGSSGLYEYSFSPWLVALPDNLYYQSGEPADDYWQYNVGSNLKPERNPRYGSLKIQKTLTSYNTALKDVTFVFQIEGTDQEGKVVYSNVVSTTHQAAGTKEAVVAHIPAGTNVTVTEIYSGASYRLETEPEKTVTVAADEISNVTFRNTYDDELTPGYGVTNHFAYDEDEGWQWSQLKDNSTGNE